MNKQEYDQKKRECWEEFLQKHEISRADGVTADAFVTAFDRAYALGKQTETITQEDIEKAADSTPLAEPKPAEPLKEGDKVKVNKTSDVLHGAIGEIIDIDIYRHCYVLFPHAQAWFEYCDLEPYTEPTDNPNPSNSGELNSKDADKQFDNIVKDGFSKERRLNIAAMAMQGIIANPNELKYAIENFPTAEGCRNRYVAIAQYAMALADALITEAKKGETR